MEDPKEELPEVRAIRILARQEIERYMNIVYEEIVTLNDYDLRRALIKVFDDAALRYRRSNR